MDKQKKLFLCGNDAVAWGVKLARPNVIAAYPITPQTVAVERLAEMTAQGELQCEYMHVESEHSALSAMMGASAAGARTFTATSSQGLLYMAECLHYASGGRFPTVMMNANRALALPWSIYGDQRDSLSLLDCGWIQAYAQDAQESLDLIIQAFKIAEHQRVLTPFMVNLDGFVVTHTYEPVHIPEQSDVDEFLPSYYNPFAMNLQSPRNMGFSTTPADTMEFKVQQHEAMITARDIIVDVDNEYGSVFGRSYGGLIAPYWTEDAELILITLGSINGTVMKVVNELREKGIRAGSCRIRYMRPFPENEIRSHVKNARAIGVLEKDISFGYEGTVFTNVKSSLANSHISIPVLNFIGGFGGRNISPEDITNAFSDLALSVNSFPENPLRYLNLGVKL